MVVYWLSIPLLLHILFPVVKYFVSTKTGTRAASRLHGICKSSPSGHNCFEGRKNLKGRKIFQSASSGYNIKISALWGSLGIRHHVYQGLPFIWWFILTAIFNLVAYCDFVMFCWFFCVCIIPLLSSIFAFHTYHVHPLFWTLCTHHQNAYRACLAYPAF